MEALLHRRVDGLVLSTARMGDDFFKELTARGVPYVLALRTNGSSLASVGDDRLGGYLATRHLLDLGHRRIGLIAGPAYASTAAAGPRATGRPWPRRVPRWTRPGWSNPPSASIQVRKRRKR